MKKSVRAHRAVLSLAILAGAATPRPAAAAGPEGYDLLGEGFEAGQLWKDKLGLSADQVRRYSIMENEKAARLKPLRERLQKGLAQLQTQLTENAPEEEVRTSLQRILEIRKAIAEQRDRFDAALEPVLTPSQRARLLVWRSLGGLDGHAARTLEASSRLEAHDEDQDRY